MQSDLLRTRLLSLSRYYRLNICYDSHSVGPAVASALAAFLLASILNINFILNHFYVHGAYLLDSGFFVGMFGGQDLLLRVPLSISGASAASFWPTHFSPTLVLFPLLHHLIPISPIVWFALIIGFIYGLLAGSIAWIIVSILGKNWYSALFAVVSSVAFIVSPPVISAVAYPHFEYLFVSLVCVFAIALGSERYIAAFVLFTLALGVREDCGFHFVAIAATYLVLARICRSFNRVDKALMVFVLYALIWSVVVLILQKTFAPGDNALARVYLGNPVFAHLNGEFVVSRIDAFLDARLGIITFWIWLCIWASVQRSLIPLAGFIAFLPWVLLNVFAVSDGPSKLLLYYGFPLTLGFLWPLFYAMWHCKGKRLSGELPVAFFVASCASFLIVATLGWRSELRAVGIDMLVPRWVNMSGARQFARQLQTRTLRSTVYVDAAVASLAPWNVGYSRLLFRDPPPARIGAIVRFTRYRQDARLAKSKAAAARLSSEFHIPNSNIVILSKDTVVNGDYSKLIFESEVHSSFAPLKFAR